MELKIPIIDDIELSPADMYNTEYYKDSGYYIVNDGVANFLVCINKNTNLVSAVTLTYEVMKDNSPKLKGIEEKLDEHLAEFDQMLALMEDYIRKTEKVVVQPHETGISVEVNDDKVSQEFVLELVTAIKKGK